MQHTMQHTMRHTTLHHTSQHCPLYYWPFGPSHNVSETDLIKNWACDFAFSCPHPLVLTILAPLLPLLLAETSHLLLETPSSVPPGLIQPPTITCMLIYKCLVTTYPITIRVGCHEKLDGCRGSWSDVDWLETASVDLVQVLWGIR